MNDLKELSYDEMLTIEGGDWLEDLGKWCHIKWCEIQDAIQEIWDSEAFAKIVSNYAPFPTRNNQ